MSDARRLARTALDRWGLGTLDEVVVLLVSELTTNAILHAHSPVEISLQASSDEVRVDVCDDSPVPPRVRWFSTEAATGRGMRLLNTLASSWGVQHNPGGGKCVWFTLAVDDVSEAIAWEFDAGSVDAL
ncbi:MAG: ATP-binding protein [Mycobacteriales bacterium]